MDRALQEDAPVINARPGLDKPSLNLHISLMALHPEFPVSPYATLLPQHRWFPAVEDLRATAYDKLIPPLVAKIRKEVFDWRNTGYAGASPTSVALLKWWFETEHPPETTDGPRPLFRYYFAQREAVESVIWLYEAKRARDKFDLLRFDSSGRVSTGMFDEDWPRYVVKMATGSGKTKVLSLLLAWSYFHKLYEPDSTLSRNFLVIAPNIIVLDRLRRDFEGLKIFYNDPIRPDNGYEGQNWQDDFQLTVHIQDDVRVSHDTGNIFLTNIHRVSLNDVRDPSLEDDDLRDYFLEAFGPRPSGRTTDSKADLGEIVREVEELAIFNDEAHHIHDKKLAWFKYIQDIHNRMLQKDVRLSFQVDVTATPRHNDGSIFVQTVSDYPLVEAIHQDVVKHPVLPDAASRARLHEQTSAIFSEKYHDYLTLGIEEWKKSNAEHQPRGQKAILFVMVDDTRNCDEVGQWLERICPELQGKVLVIHTKSNGEISEAASAKSIEELKKLRDAANAIDSWRSPYEAIVSVLMLKEGWDVRNVTTIVGLRAYSTQSDILPEQTIGRGLRPMYRGGDVEETVSVMGTPKFMEFVESIHSEGVTLETRPMGDGAGGRTSMVIEVDEQNEEKDIPALDISLPRLSRRFHREFKELDDLDPAALHNQRLALQPFTDEETREIVFKTMLDGEVHHTIQIDGGGPADYRSVVAFFARQLMKDLRLVGGYDVLYGKIKAFMREHLFAGAPVDLENPVVLRNLSESAVNKVLYDSFKKAINALTVQDAGTTRIEARIRLREMRPFGTDARRSLAPKKSLFNRIVGQAGHDGFELMFATFLDNAPDIISFGKNYPAVGFRFDYVKADGDLSTYTPDFLVKAADGAIWIVETKGRAELDVPQNMARLKQWCADASAAEDNGQKYDFVYVDEDGFERHRPATFAALIRSFTEYKA